MEKKQKRRKEKGITLVALVVTIIVLIILAGITLSIVIDENGIILKAEEAKNETKQAQEDEKNTLGKAEDMINEYLTGITVEQVTDKNPGTLEADGADVYVINSIEDLVFFAYDVRMGNTYQNKTVKLGLSLDFNSTKSYVDAYRTDYGEYGYDGELKTLLTSGEGFKPIGNASDEVGSNSFSGIFNGQENQIKNLYIDEKDETDGKLGFFSVNYGNIENLNLVDVNITRYEEIASLTGGLVGQNRADTVIRNCGISGSIKIKGPGSGAGLVGHNMGEIENCYNLADVTLETEILEGALIAGISNTTTGPIYRCFNAGNLEFIANDLSTLQSTIIDIGGISSYSQNAIQECYNLGSIYTKILANEERETHIRVGGICGNAESTISNCYNRGEIEVNSSKATLYIGGIRGTGTNANENYVENCYNIGDIKFNCEGDLYTGGVSGVNGNIANCYYLNQSDYTNAESGVIKTESEMKEDSFVEQLNEKNQMTIWKKDTLQINNGYPIFIWQ